MSGIPLLSFFSGGGFLDLGVESAGFNVVWANEVHEAYAAMYKAGISSWREATKRPNSEQDILVNRKSIEELSHEDILSEAFGDFMPGFFGVIGGPPCQDFSPSGKDRGSKGERGKLTRSFADKILSLRPSFFLMENVPGLYREKHREFYNSIVADLKEGESGYLVSMRILNALEYGVPQDRVRLFLIGFRKDILATEYNLESLIGRKDWFPWPGKLFDGAKSLEWPKTSPFGKDKVAKPNDIPLELTIGELVREEVKELPNGQEGFNPYSDKFQLIAEGDVSGKSFKRLHRYRYSPTVWYGNNEVHLHPWQPRRLTVREALKIQTVPDEYVLPSENTLTDKFKIISNGVPALLAQTIGKAILEYIRDKNLVDQHNTDSP
jgi:DNA (cytosine-5)-methyltransferase 1